MVTCNRYFCTLILPLGFFTLKSFMPKKLKNGQACSPTFFNGRNLKQFGFAAPFDSEQLKKITYKHHKACYISCSMAGRTR